MTHLSKTKFYIVSVALLMVALPHAATAQSSGQTSAPLTDLYACERVADKDDQLACFLKETAKLRADETSGDLIAVEKESVAQFKKDFAEKTKTPKRRTLAIVSTSTVGASQYTRFTLDNGEVWQQIEPARIRLGKSNADTLMIKKASLGSFIARVNDKRPSFRVKQIK